MPMTDIQRRSATVFRIRFGEKQGGKPKSLTDAIRVSSANREIVEAFVAVYGGETEPWDSDGTRDKWQAKLPTDFLRILLLPGQSISQWWEKWSGSVCDRRCDGVKETKSNKACMCDPDVELRMKAKGQCRPTTRVQVYCPDVAVIGAGMFICNGLVGAETLPQSVLVAEEALARGFFVPAVLRVVEHKGRTRYIVPQIETVGISTFNMLEAADSDVHALQSATQRVLGGVHPRFPAAGELTTGETRTVEEQFDPPRPKARKNQAQDIPSTGTEPRTADEAVQPDVIDADGEEVVVDPRFGWPVGEGDTWTVAMVQGLKGAQLTEALKQHDLELGGTEAERQERLMTKLGIGDESF